MLKYEDFLFAASIEHGFVSKETFEKEVVPLFPELNSSILKGLYVFYLKDDVVRNILELIIDNDNLEIGDNINCEKKELDIFTHDVGVEQFRECADKLAKYGWKIVNYEEELEYIKSEEG